MTSAVRSFAARPMAVVTALYEVQPFGTNRFLNTAFSNWRVGVLETLQSGPPFTVITAANTTNAFPAGESTRYAAPEGTGTSPWSGPTP